MIDATLPHHRAAIKSAKDLIKLLVALNLKSGMLSKYRATQWWVFLDFTDRVFAKLN